MSYCAFANGVIKTILIYLLLTSNLSLLSTAYVPRRKTTVDDQEVEFQTSMTVWYVFECYEEKLMGWQKNRSRSLHWNFYDWEKLTYQRREGSSGKVPNQLQVVDIRRNQSNSDSRWRGPLNFQRRPFKLNDQRCICAFVCWSLSAFSFPYLRRPTVNVFDVADSIVVHRPPQEEQSTPRSDGGKRRKRFISSTDETNIINKINSLRSSVGASNMNYLVWSFNE